MDPKKKHILLRIDLQCGTCGALSHRAETTDASEKKEPRSKPYNPADGMKFCPCCGAGFERFCMRCRKKVDMYFEEYWPEEDECVRTYVPAKRCPHCNAGLEVENRDDGTEE
ncbi:MAG: hypothetical protein KGL53_03050 [Elusimicrobia bacterium]|nr:hypothetical protein [Elusimicrobiota bacterium]